MCNQDFSKDASLELNNGSKYQIFFSLILFIGFVCISVSCSNISAVHQTPTAILSDLTTKHVQPTAEPQSAEFNINQDTASAENDDPDGDLRSTDEGFNLAYLPPRNSQLDNDELDFVLIPTGDPPILDGTISPGEWDHAVMDAFADGNEIRLMQNGEFFYLSLRANNSEMIAGNVFIQQNDHIQILHSSAALGTARYLLDDQYWRKDQNFTWHCRSTGDSVTARDERADFLQEEKWLAANARMGTPNELEYQIKIPSRDFRLAAVIIGTVPPYELIAWPDVLKDDCINPSPNGLPEEMQFTPEQWIMFDVGHSQSE